MYKEVFVAGTFDGLHKGHQMLLATACTEGEHVTVGLTTDAFAKQYKTQPVAAFDERKVGVEAWFTKNGWLGRTTIIPIEDKYEPAASDPAIDAIIVTSQNRVNGEAINERRKTHGLTALTLIEVPLVSAEDGSPISSTRVRGGEIDVHGKLTMPETLRVELRKPLGTVISGSAIIDMITKERGRTIVTVGDVVTKTFLAAGVTPALSIIDLRVGRQQDNELAGFGAMGKHIKSGPGFIAREAIAAIGEWAESLAKNRNPEVIVIDGEEDLLVLPVLLAAPLDTLVYYGQPDRIATQSVAGGPPFAEDGGIVEVEVTIEKKKEMTELLRKFSEET